MERCLLFALFYGAFAWTSLAFHYIATREIYTENTVIIVLLLVMTSFYHLVRISQIILTRDLRFVRCKWKHAYLISLAGLVPWVLISCVLLPWNLHEIYMTLKICILHMSLYELLYIGWLLAPLATTVSIYCTYVLRKRHSAKNYAND